MLAHCRRPVSPSPPQRTNLTHSRHASRSPPRTTKSLATPTPSSRPRRRQAQPEVALWGCGWWPSGRPMATSTPAALSKIPGRGDSACDSMMAMSVKWREKISCCVIPFHWRLRSLLWWKMTSSVSVSEVARLKLAPAYFPLGYTCSV